MGLQELMVKSHSAPVRQLCAGTLLQFLLDYPTGPKRLQQHLQFLLTNLAYEHETGRQQALEMTQQVGALWHDQILQTQSMICSI